MKNDSKCSLVLLIFGVSLVALLCDSCENEKVVQKEMTVGEVKNVLEEVNKKMIRNEEEEIDNYIKRHAWDMKQTGTGLRYVVYSRGEGHKAVSGKIAKINYEISLINGFVVYSSKQTGPKTFKIGEAQVESGIHEGVLLLRVGDRAKFILPAHKAFGLPGDYEKIPERATLIYDVELLEIK